MSSSLIETPKYIVKSFKKGKNVFIGFFLLLIVTWQREQIPPKVSNKNSSVNSKDSSVFIGDTEQVSVFYALFWESLVLLPCKQKVDSFTSAHLRN